MPLSLLQQLIALPSINPMGGPVDPSVCFESRMTAFLEELFRGHGWECEVDPIAAGRANVLARLPGRAGSPCILLDAHQDTVPVKGMTIDPFQSSVVDGRVYGRGACDVKGGLAAMIVAMRRLQLERPGAHATVVLACTCDEELGQLGARRLVDRWSQGGGRLLPAAPELAVVAEPTELHVVVAHRGTVRWRIATEGLAAHSSDPTKGKNAIYAMAKVIEALERYAAILPLRDVAHPLCGESTLSVGRIQGGVSVNVVPDYCEIEIDRRLLPGQSPIQAMGDVELWLRDQIDATFKMLPPDTIGLPLSDQHNRLWGRRLLDAARRTRSDRELVGVPFGTHAARYAADGVASLVFGPGSIDQAHTKDEWLDARQLSDAADILFDFLSSL